MSAEEDAVEDLLKHFFVAAFFPEKPKCLAVAVSGGGDSMALLDLMARHSNEQGFKVRAVTVDHGLRAEAAAEIDMVARHCATLDIEHHVLKWTWDGQGNLQAKARVARYTLIADWAQQHNVDHIALGHTSDDQAETFLMRLSRRAGVAGLARMEQHFERHGVTWIRPLLALSRAQLRDYLTRQGVAWAEDPSNDDENFERVKARKVLSALDPLGIDADVLSSVSANLWIAETALQSYAVREAEAHVQVVHGDVILPTENSVPDHAIPYEVLFRLRRAALQYVSGADYPPRADAIFEMEKALAQGETHALHGCIVSRIKGKRRFEGRWRVTRELNAVKDLRCASDQIWDGRWRFNGPHAPGLEIRALGEAVNDCPDWRETGLLRRSLLASPAIWRMDTLVAAPLAGFSAGWRAELAAPRDEFTAFLKSR